MISDEKRRSRLAGPSSKKVKFTKAEDATLAVLVKELGTKDWKTIAQHMVPRTARQCRERWTNYVNPSLSQDPWTQEEDILLVEKHLEFGNHWKLIEKYFPKRSKNNIKHRWSILQSIVNTIPASTINMLANTTPDPSSITVSPNSTSQAININTIIPNSEIEIPSETAEIHTIPTHHQQNRIVQPILHSNPPPIQHHPSQSIFIVQPPPPPPQPPIQPSLSLSFFLNNTHPVHPDADIEEKPLDTFRYFDRILDNHEMYINEIDNNEAWSFSEGHQFF